MNTITATIAGKTITVASTREVMVATSLARLAQARETIAKAQAEVVSATEHLAETLGTGKHVLEGFGEVTVSENNTYSDAKMLAALKVGQQRLVTKRVLDRAKVKAQYPDVYAAAKQPAGWKATARLY